MSGRQQEITLGRKNALELVKAQKKQGKVRTTKAVVQEPNWFADLIGDCKTREDLEMLDHYVSSEGTKKERAEFNKKQKEILDGKTLKQLKNSAKLQEYEAAIANAESLDDLKQLEKQAGNLRGSEEFRMALNNKKYEIDFNEAYRAERMESARIAFERGTHGYAKPTESSKLTLAQLYEKIYGKKYVPTKSETDIAKMERIAAEKIEASNMVEKAKDLESRLNVANNELLQRGNEIAQKTEEIAQKTEEIAQKTEEIAQKAEEIAKKGDEIENLTANLGKTKKIMKAGAIAATVALIGLGVGWIISNKKKNEKIEEQQRSNEQLVSTIDQLQEQQETEEVVQEPAVPEVTEEQQTEEGVTEQETPVFARAAVDGDCYWDWCREALKAELGVNPTNNEVLTATRAYLTTHGIPLSEDNYHAPLNPGDPLYKLPQNVVDQIKANRGE